MTLIYTIGKNGLPYCLHQNISLFVHNHKNALISFYIFLLLFDLYPIEVLRHCIVFILSHDKHVL